MKTIEIARKLRKTQTPLEARLWYYLRSRRFQGFKFRRQYPISNFIVDFCCLRQKLIIELDGGQHNESANQSSDIKRDQCLVSMGYQVLRFWNNDLDNNLGGVLEKIFQTLEPSPLTPLPKGEGRVVAK